MECNKRQKMARRKRQIVKKIAKTYNLKHLPYGKMIHTQFSH